MNLVENHDPMAVLAHWTYTRDEWRWFTRWKKLKKGVLHYIIYFFSLKGGLTIPQVKITSERVWIGNIHWPFSNNDHRLKRIEIRDEGRLNIMEITYERTGEKIPGSDEIRIPVPKGKLREAIEVQERLIHTIQKR